MVTRKQVLQDAIARFRRDGRAQIAVEEKPAQRDPAPKAKVPSVADSKPKEKTPEPNCLLYDREQGRQLVYLPEAHGLLFNYRGKDIYRMRRTIVDGTAVLEPIAPPAALGILPEDLYEALHDEDTATWMTADETGWQKAATIGMWVLIALALILFIYLMNKKG